MSAAELDLALEELRPLQGVQLQRVVQPDPRTVCLRLMRSWVLLGARPGRCRIHLLSDRPGALPPEPGPFCMLLRKVLLNSRLVSVQRQQDDRVVRLQFLGGTLLAQLVDRWADLLLLDPEDKILGSLTAVRGELQQGAPYVPLSPPPRRVDPAIRPWARSSADLEAHYRRLDRDSVLEGMRTRVRRALKKGRRTLKKVEGDLARCHEADQLRKWADLLMAQQSLVQGRGLSSVELPDLFEQDGPPVSIPLDPRLGVVDNAQALYRKQSRLTRGAEHVNRRLEAARQRVAALQDLAAALQEDSESTADEAELLRQVEALCPPSRRGKPRGGSAAGAARLPYHRFTSSDGLEVLVGRGARDNHQLTFQVARGNDHWLHVRDLPGCHGVVRTRGADPVPHRTLLEAATLVAHFSKVRAGDTVEVSHTRRKNVRPVTGAPGKVYVSDARTLRIKVEQERLDRLLGRG